MILPHAIVRASEWCGRHNVGARGTPLIGITHGSLTLLATHDDRAVTRDNASDYLDAVQRIADEIACVPFRGDKPIDRDAAQRLLRAGEARFTSLLDRLENHDEWTVHIDRDQPQQREPVGERSYLSQRRDELAVADGLPPVAARTAASLLSAITEVKPDTRLIATDHGASLRLLLDRDTAGATIDQLHRFAQEQQIACTIIGPWPAFSFVSPL
ncbi:MAG: GvpL/GvpF family gas vesicle protein [Planctomycetota bacterium]